MIPAFSAQCHGRQLFPLIPLMRIIRAIDTQRGGWVMSANQFRGASTGDGRHSSRITRYAEIPGANHDRAPRVAMAPLPDRSEAASDVDRRRNAPDVRAMPREIPYSRRIREH